VADSNNLRVRQIGLATLRAARANVLIADEGGQLVYEFNSDGQHLRTFHALTGTTLYTFKYNSAGLLTSIIDADGGSTIIQRNGSGQPTAIVAPLGQRTELSVNGDGYLTGVTNPMGKTTRFGYGDYGLLKTVTIPDVPSGTFSFDYDGAGYHYDGAGYLVKASDRRGGADGLSSEGSGGDYSVTVAKTKSASSNFAVAFASNGACEQIKTRPDGAQVDRVSLADGSSQTTLPEGSVVADLLGPDPRFGMQAPVHKVRQIASPGGRTSTIAISRTANLKTSGNPLSLTKLTETITVNNKVTTIVYDNGTRSLTRTSPEGRRAVTTLDAQGRLAGEAFDEIDPAVYTYDTSGHVKTVSQDRGATARTFTFAYDTQGYLRSITDPLGGTTEFECDALGWINNVTFPDGRQVSLDYDVRGNLVSITPPDRSAHTFDYNAVGLLSRYTPPGGSQYATSYSYDEDRRPLSTTLPGGRTVTFVYDGAGRVLDVKAPEGTIHHGYNAAGQVSSLTVYGRDVLSFEYDGWLMTALQYAGTVDGRVDLAYNNDFLVSRLDVNGTVVAGFDYDGDNLLVQAGNIAITRAAQAGGRITGTTLGQVTDAWTYDSANRLTSYEAKFGGTTIFRADFTHDVLNRIVTRKETVLGGAAVTYAYSYDQAGRLTTVKKNGTTTGSYGFDGNDNRVSSLWQGAAVAGSYDDRDAIMTYGTDTFTHSENGELITWTSGAGTATYGYDSFGHLRTADLPGGTEIEYFYDGWGRRIGKEVNGTLVQGFLYAAGRRPVAELDGSGNVVSTFVYGTRPHVPDYMVRGGTEYRIISDNLGSPRLVVNAQTGAVAQRIDYDEFGNVTQDTNPGFQPFGFIGGLYDRDTGLVCIGGREYMPKIGRWTTRDPNSFFGGDTNLYVYGLADPVNYYDPLGTQNYGIGGGVPQTYSDQPTYGEAVYGARPGASDRVQGGVGFFSLMVDVLRAKAQVTVYHRNKRMVYDAVMKETEKHPNVQYDFTVYYWDNPDCQNFFRVVPSNSLVEVPKGAQRKDIHVIFVPPGVNRPDLEKPGVENVYVYTSTMSPTRPPIDQRSKTR